MNATSKDQKTEGMEYVENVINLLQHVPINLDDIKNDEKLKTTLDKLVAEGKVELVYRLREQKTRKRRIYFARL